MASSARSRSITSRASAASRSCTDSSALASSSSQIPPISEIRAWTCTRSSSKAETMCAMPTSCSCAVRATARPSRAQYSPRGATATMTVLRQFCDRRKRLQAERRFAPVGAALGGSRARPRRARQPDGEGAALAEGRGDLEPALVAVEDVLDDGEPEPGAALVAAGGDAHAVEALGQAVDVLARDARAVVLDGDAVAVRVRLARRRGEDAHGRALAAVLHRVVDEVGEDLRELVAVAEHPRARRRRARSRASRPAGAATGSSAVALSAAIWFSDHSSTGRTCSVISMRLSDIRSSTSRCIRPASRAMIAEEALARLRVVRGRGSAGSRCSR